MEWKPVVFVLFPGRAGLCRKEGHFGSESIPPWPILSGCDSWMWNIYGMHAQTHNRDTDMTNALLIAVHAVTCGAQPGRAVIAMFPV